ncbi:MAG: hypothetical protein WBE71_16985 [Xanthobacteraceae bacterium]
MALIFAMAASRAIMQAASGDAALANGKIQTAAITTANTLLARMNSLCGLVVPRRLNVQGSLHALDDALR